MPAPTRATFLDAVDYLARTECRSQRHRNLMRLAWELASRTASDMVTAPKHGATWDVLAEELGVSRRTIGYLLAWMRDHRLLVTVTPGSTVRTRPGNLWGRLDDGLGNLAAEYALTVPADLIGDLEETPALKEPEDEQVPWPVETVTERPTFSQVNAPVDNLCTPAVHGYSSAKSLPNAGASVRASTTTPSPWWSRHVTPGTRKDQLAACQRLRSDNRLTLGVLSAKDLRSLLRQAFVAGHTVADVEHALNRMPDGRHWGDIDPGRLVGSTERVRVLRSRIRHRISLWVAADGTPVVRSVSQQAEDDEAAIWGAQVRRLNLAWGTPEEDDAPVAPVVELPVRRPLPAAYLAAREALRTRKEAM